MPNLQTFTKELDAAVQGILRDVIEVEGGFVGRPVSPFKLSRFLIPIAVKVYEFLVEASPVVSGVYRSAHEIFTTDGQAVYTHPTWAQLEGLSPKELDDWKKQNGDTIVPAPDLGQVKSAIRRVARRAVPGYIFANNVYYSEIVESTHGYFLYVGANAVAEQEIAAVRAQVFGQFGDEEVPF